MRSDRRTLGGAWLLAGALTVALLGACDDPVRVEPTDEDPGPDRVETAVKRVELSAPYEAIFQGDTLRVTAVALDAAGAPLPSVSLTWTSSDPTVATVDNGLVSALRPGPVTILASSGDTQGALGIVVSADVFAVYALPAGIESLPGKQVPLKVVNRFANEVRVPATYSSSDSSVATVSERGVVTTKAPGSAVVTIRYLTRRLEVPVQVRAPGAGYRLTYLGDLGAAGSYALGLNERGQVVGRAVTPSGTWVGFVWENGGMREIAFPGAAYTEAVAINESGVVVGNAGSTSCTNCVGSPWRWEDGTLTPIQLAEDPRTVSGPRVTDINDQGQVSGYSYYQGMRGPAMGTAFVWHDGEVRWLSQPAGSRGQADDINNDGVIVGRIESIANGTWGTGWTNTGEFRASPPPVSSSFASAINDRGQVAGYVYPNTEDLVGLYLWTDGQSSLLGSPDLVKSTPTAMSDRGEIVGGTGAAGSIPFLWRAGRFLDLSLLVDDPDWTVTAATDINDRGQIVGHGRHRVTGATGALLLTPAQ